MSPSVLVIGGGISGLATARELLEGDPKVEVLVVEAADRPGGTMGTELVSGFVFERGPNGFLDNVPHTLDLARALGLGERVLPCADAAKARFLLKDGRLCPLPMGPGDLLRTPLLSLRGRLRVLCEPFQPRGGEVEDSVASFGRRRIGAEATATFLDPLVTGIYAGDVERVSLPAAFPRIAALEREHGSLVRGMIAKARERRRARRAGAEGAGGAAEPAAGPAGGPAGPGGRLCSFEGGLEDLVAALRDRLGPRLKLGTPAEAVRWKGDGFEAALRDKGRGQAALRAQAVVAAVPAPKAAVLVSSWKPDLSMALEEIPYAPVAVVCLGVRREDVTHSLDGFGFLVPRDQGVRTLGVIFVSTLFPAHAPPGTVSLRVLLGGARDPEVVGWSDEELLALAGREVGPVLGLRGEPVARRIYRYSQGIPQYNVGHSKRLQRIDGWLRQIPGLFVTGNAYRGVGVNECVAEAHRVAGEVLAFLRARVPA